MLDHLLLALLLNLGRELMIGHEHATMNEHFTPAIVLDMLTFLQRILETEQQLHECLRIGAVGFDDTFMLSHFRLAG